MSVIMRNARFIVQETAGGYGENLISNGTFEVNITGWSVDAGNLFQSSEQAHTGTYSLKYVGTDPYGSWNNPPIAATSGTIYHIDFWLWIPTGEYCQISIYEDSPIYGEKIGSSWDGGFPHNTWYNFQYDYTQNSTCGLYLEVGREMPYSTDNYYQYIDDVTIREIL